MADEPNNVSYVDKKNLYLCVFLMDAVCVRCLDSRYAQFHSDTSKHRHSVGDFCIPIVKDSNLTPIKSIAV